MTTEHVEYRFEVLRGGVKTGELRSAGDASITMQTSGAVKTDLSGTFRLDPGFDILTDRIRPMYYADGKWSPLGVYVVNDRSASYFDGNGLMKLSALDLGYLVERHPVEERPYFEAGEAYTEIVMRLLADCGITRVRADSSTLRLRSDREDWEIGTSSLTIINELLREINYDDLWFDMDGYARLGRVDTSGPAMHAYRADQYSIIAPKYEVTVDTGGAYNVFRAYVSSAEGEVMVAEAENNDPSSSISTARIGRNVLLEKLNDIASQEELERYVLDKRNASMSGTEQVTYRTAVRSHGVGDTVYLHHHMMRGVYRETGWTITFGGEMTHTARRMVLL